MGGRKATESGFSDTRPPLRSGLGAQKTIHLRTLTAPLPAFFIGQLVSVHGVFDEVVAPTRRPTINAMMPEWPVGGHIVMTVKLVATARGTRMTVAQRVAEPGLADSAPIVRHRN